MIDQEWLQQRRSEVQRDLHATMIRAEQLKGALAMLEEIDAATVVAAEGTVVAAEGNGADPTTP